MLNSETKRHIDAARDVLVGVAPNPTTQIDQITYALIYKFMDDMDQAAIRAGGEPSFFVGDLEPFAWSKLVDSRMGNQEKMNQYGAALIKFSEAKQLPELFRTIFRSAFLPYRSPETLGLFLKEISHFDYSHPEELGNAYEYLLSIMASQGDAGQFRTPRHIIDFIVELINPSKDDKILDPACGTGGFLVSAYNHILEQHDGKNDINRLEKTLTPDERKKLMQNLQGYDIDPTMVRIAQVNMYLHQFKSPQIFQYDSLTNDERWTEKFDVIMANPPFMTPKGGIQPHKKFSINSSRSEVLFVDYIIGHMKPRGRAAVVVYEPVLFQSSAAHIELRKKMIQDGLVCVVSLPRGVFEPYSGVKTSILFFDKDLAERIGTILFSKINKDGFELTALRKPEENNDLPKVANEVKSWFDSKSDALDLSIEISREQVKADENVSLIVERFFTPDVPTGENAVVIGDLLAPVSKVPRVRNENLPILSITMTRGLVDQSEKFNKRIASADISNYKKVFRDQLVIGFPIDEGVLGFQQKYEAAAVSPAYEVWELRDIKSVNIRYLELLLRSPYMRDIYRSQMQSSVSRRRSVPKALFLKIQLPLPTLEIQNKVVSEIENNERIATDAMTLNKLLMVESGLL
jgi:type I restriction enzyme M protein